MKDPKREQCSLDSRVGWGRGLSLLCEVMTLLLASCKTVFSSFVRLFLQNRLIDIFKHSLYMVLLRVFACLFGLFFIFSNTITSFYCSSVISELFIHHLQVLGKERSITYGC